MAAIDMTKLNAMNTDDLYALNKAVVEVIRQRQTMRSIQAGARFCIGDEATFYSKGRRVTIRINKINVKSINGTDIATGVQWRVAPSLLTPVAKVA